MGSSKENNGVDLFKFIMAIAVIAIHTQPLIDCNSEMTVVIYSNIVHSAVPFFFLSFGFYLASKLSFKEDGKDVPILDQKIKKYTELYLIWIAIYFPLEIMDNINTGRTFSRSFLSCIRRIIFVGELYNSWHLWYLLSTVYALIIIRFLVKNGFKTSWTIATVLLFWMMQIGADYLVGADIDMTAARIIKKAIALSIDSGRIFKGVIFICIGMLIYKLGIEKLGIHIMITIFAISFICDCFFYSKIISSLLGILIAVSMFGVAHALRLKSCSYYRNLRNMSKTIYFIHMYVFTISCLALYSEVKYGWKSFVITATISIIIAIAYEGIKTVFQRNN